MRSVCLSSYLTIAQITMTWPACIFLPPKLKNSLFPSKYPFLKRIWRTEPERETFVDVYRSKNGRSFEEWNTSVSISVGAPPAWCVPSWRSQSSSQRRSPFSPGTSFIHVSDLFLPPLPPRIHTAFITEGNENGIYTVEPNMRQPKPSWDVSSFPHSPSHPLRLQKFFSQSQSQNTAIQNLSLVPCK